MSFVWFILVGLVAGWLAGVVMKGGGYGILGDIIGVVGALLGRLAVRNPGPGRRRRTAGQHRRGLHRCLYSHLPHSLAQTHLTTQRKEKFSTQ